MKLVLTLVEGDDADLLDANLAFHFAAGVDVVRGSGSTEQTRAILERYAAEGRRDVGDTGADAAGDWFFEAEANEFWWPRGGSLKEVLAVVPPRFGGVQAMTRQFVARPPGDDGFAERLTIRRAEPAVSDDDPHAPRAETGRRIAAAPDAPLLHGWYPIDVLRFPLSSADAPIVDDAALAAGLRDGTLVEDTRLRDALRQLARGESLDFSHSVVDAAYVAAVARLEEHGALVRAQRRIEVLERRLSALEAGLPARLRSRLARVSRR